MARTARTPVPPVSRTPARKATPAVMPARKPVGRPSVTATAPKSAPPAKATHKAADAAVEAPKPEFDWDALPEAEEIVYTRSTVVSFDPERDTPEVIKKRLAQSFAGGTYDAQTGKFQPKTIRQPCNSQEQAEAFVKAAQKYTRAIGEHSFMGAAKNGVVTFSVRPKITRTRKAK